MKEFQSTRTFLLKRCAPNWPEEVFWISKVKNTAPWTYIISDLHAEEIHGTLYKKELQKTNQTEFRVEKVFNRKGDKLYVKWKGYDNPSINWINKKRYSIATL